MALPCSSFPSAGENNKPEAFSALQEDAVWALPAQAPSATPLAAAQTRAQHPAAKPSSGHLNRPAQGESPTPCLTSELIKRSTETDDVYRMGKVAFGHFGARNLVAAPCAEAAFCGRSSCACQQPPPLTRAQIEYGFVGCVLQRCHGGVSA